MNIADQLEHYLKTYGCDGGAYELIHSLLSLIKRHINAFSTSYNHLKYQYETDKQKIERMQNWFDREAAIVGLNILGTVLNENEKALREAGAVIEAMGKVNRHA